MFVVFISGIACTSQPTQSGALSIDARGAPPTVLKINHADAARLKCQDGAVLQPGGALPPLPWDLEVTRASDGQVLYSDHVTQLPRWLLIYGDRVTASTSPILGPAAPPCP